MDISTIIGEELRSVASTTSAKRLALTFALAISALSPAQTAASKQITVNGETRLMFGAATVIVQTRETKAPNENAIYANRNSPCTGGRVPCLVTESFQIRVNGKPIYVPYSAFADLGDMASLKIQHLANYYVLTIYGGDASVSYVAKLNFDANRILERVVAPGEDSTQPSERTVYYNPKRFE